MLTIRTGEGVVIAQRERLVEAQRIALFQASLYGSVEILSEDGMVVSAVELARSDRSD